MKSIVLFGIALASATIVIIFGLTATNHLNVPAFLQEAISMITTGERCAKNGEWASIADEDGFAAVKPFHGAPQLKAKTETPDRKPGLYEFVLLQTQLATLLWCMIHVAIKKMLTSGITYSNSLKHLTPEKMGYLSLTAMIRVKAIKQARESGFEQMTQVVLAF